MTKIVVLGGGKIGEALISGLVNAGVDPQSITVTGRRAERGEELRERYGVRDTTDNRLAAEDADVVFLCVKPKMIVDVLGEISGALEENDVTTVLVSMAAGIPLAAMEDAVVAGTPVVRVMPNTPMLVGQGASVLAAGRHVRPEHLDQVREMLASVGTVSVVPESQIDAVTAVSGSGPAYFFLVAEAMIDAGVSLGLSRAVATELVVQTMTGSAAMLAQSGDKASDLRAAVTSPGGTTAAAVRELERGGLRTAFYEALEAARARSVQLGGSAE